MQRAVRRKKNKKFKIARLDNRQNFSISTDKIFINNHISFFDGLTDYAVEQIVNSGRRQYRAAWFDYVSQYE
jgi:hypothetical protein